MTREVKLPYVVATKKYRYRTTIICILLFLSMYPSYYLIKLLNKPMLMIAVVTEGLWFIEYLSRIFKLKRVEEKESILLQIDGKGLFINSDYIRCEGLLSSSILIPWHEITELSIKHSRRPMFYGVLIKRKKKQPVWFSFEPLVGIYTLRSAIRQASGKQDALKGKLPLWLQ